ncbi:MAG: hypothetical protein HXS40_06600 [Theionarchaea archaeon]|nr:hypothetical protein [Theionarchaea archaeon]
MICLYARMISVGTGATPYSPSCYGGHFPAYPGICKNGVVPDSGVCRNGAYGAGEL